jgi:hypothetical protein
MLWTFAYVIIINIFITPSLRWLVLYLVVVRGLVRLCDPESNICRGSSPWQV